MFNLHRVGLTRNAILILMFGFVPIGAISQDEPASQLTRNGAAAGAASAEAGVLSIGTQELEETHATVTIRQAGKVLLTYNKRSPAVPAGIDAIYARSGFLHPVASPAGQVVTETFPIDHAHQHGIFTAWVKTQWNDREIDFWNLAGGTGRVLHERIVRTFVEDGQIGFEADLIHRAEKLPAVDVLRERWKITAIQTDGTYHGFDLETTQSAITDAPLLIQKYHYGGVAYRGPVRWLSEDNAGVEKQFSDVASGIREQSSISNDLGSDRIRGNHEHSRWVSVTGKINDQPLTVSVLCHRDNFRAPQAARLHPTKPYFVFSPCVDGEFTIDRDHPYSGRYRYLISDAVPDSEWLNAQWESWCSR